MKWQTYTCCFGPRSFLYRIAVDAIIQRRRSNVSSTSNLLHRKFYTFQFNLLLVYCTNRSFKKCYFMRIVELLPRLPRPFVMWLWLRIIIIEIPFCSPHLRFNFANKIYLHGHSSHVFSFLAVELNLLPRWIYQQYYSAGILFSLIRMKGLW